MTFGDAKPRGDVCSMVNGREDDFVVMAKIKSYGEVREELGSGRPKDFCCSSWSARACPKLRSGHTNIVRICIDESCSSLETLLA